jgi:hypothetical protein
VRRDASVPFEIITPKRIYEFIASTEKDCLYWVRTSVVRRERA